MRVAVIGATGVIGRSVVPELVSAGHEVVGLARTPDKARLLRSLGAEPHHTSLADHAGLVAMFDGADAVCNFATHVPVGLSAVRPHAWRSHDRLRTEGVRRVVEAAREARVRRVVQESVSFLYADQGDEWIAEDAPLHSPAPMCVTGRAKLTAGTALRSQISCGRPRFRLRWPMRTERVVYGRRAATDPLECSTKV